MVDFCQIGADVLTSVRIMEGYFFLRWLLFNGIEICLFNAKTVDLQFLLAIEIHI